MSNKLGCPVCGSYTSSIFEAAMDGYPCPVCGCPAEIINEVDRLQVIRGDEKLKERIEELLSTNGKLRIENMKLLEYKTRIERITAED